MAWNPEDISVREQLIRAAVAALGAGGSPATAVYRSMLDQIIADRNEDGSSQLACYDVTPGDAKRATQYDDHDAMGWTLPLIVRGLADATNADDGVLDPFYLFANRSLVTATANFGGQALKAEQTGDLVVFRPAGAAMVGMEMQFELTFTVLRGDPAQRG